jgi:hypothetical protein
MTASRTNRFARTQLGIECLQARVMPAVVVTQLDLDGDGASDDIRIVGDNAINKVSIQDNAAGVLTVSIDANGDGDFTDVGEKNGVNYLYSGNSVVFDVNLAANNDSFAYTLTNNVSAGMRTFAVDLGLGNDTFNFDATGKNFLAGSRLNLDVVGQAGIDTANINVGQVFASQASVQLDLGLGNDTSTVTFGRLDNKAVLDLDASLGVGTNSMTVDLSQIGFGDQANANVNITGGTGADTVTVNLHDDVGDGTKASALLINVALSDGNDSFTANMDYDKNVFRVDDHSVVSINVHGGAGNDTLIAQGSGAAGTIRVDPDGLLDLNLKGDTGDDTVKVDFGKADAFELIGTVRAWIDGGAGNDKLTALFGNNANSTGQYDISVTGKGGDDQVTFGLTNNGGTPTYGTLGKAYLNGGIGIDVLTNGNAAVSSAIAFETIV